eukprot:CAMPEP_0195608496 /NCGR_PEP_ID=MMETSP0815-20121206/8770_1 /TAXON_ID=97485 /ORGANISM="Prymnesium parvum, Strain Texoma1" /LENGTH=331 /DNA_ID=CAMNT_0040748349 /DNA_START=42 /DNA_END=1037 /DNA_ORIENTATION=-
MSSTLGRGLEFKRSHQGQLAPPYPSAEQLVAGCTECGGVRTNEHAILQRGPYMGLWIRTRASASSAGLFALVDDALVEQAAVPAPVYVTLLERGLQPGLIEALLARGFAYHHFRSQEHTGHGGEFVYYKWPDGSHDAVPAYATSIEGIGVILLAPDEKSVLLVWEYGAWKPPSGAVDLKESKLRAAVREIHEEVGLVVDESFPPLYLGGWQQSQARDQLINDNFTFFAVKALPGEVVVDGVEIQEAKWFSIDEILRICEREDVRAKEAMGNTVQIDLGTSKTHNEIATTALSGVKAFAQGQWLPCDEVVASRRPTAFDLRIGCFSGKVADE